MSKRIIVAILVVLLFLIFFAYIASLYSEATDTSERQTVQDEYGTIAAATVATSSHVSLDNLPPSVGKLPTSVGHCDKTTVTRIGTRLQNGDGSDVPGTGSAISYADGGYQVSYDTITGVTDSKVGDEVMLCLVSTPADCPPGDDRGRVYQAINLRTAEEWTAQDSEHSCGGA